MSDFFYKIKGEEGVQVRILMPNITVLTVKCGLTAAKIAEILKIKRKGRVSHVRTLRPIFTVITLKMWAYNPQVADIGNFWYKFSQKGYTPLSDFYKIWLWEGVPGSHPHSKFRHCGLKIWEYSPQNRRNWYFYRQACVKRSHAGIVFTQ